jgi:hypothetical protein
MCANNDDNETRPRGQGDKGELTEGQKAMQAAKRKKLRRGVSIAPSNNPDGIDEITIEPDDEGATPSAEAEFVKEDAPLAKKPSDTLGSPERQKRAKKQIMQAGNRTGQARAKRPQVELTDPRDLPLTPDALNSNRVHGGAKKLGSPRQ